MGDAGKGDAGSCVPGNPRRPTSGDLDLVIIINGQRRSIALVDLLDSEIANDLREDCSIAAKPVRIYLDDLLHYTDQLRWCVLTFISNLDCYKVDVRKGVFDNLFDAVLTMLVGTADLDLYQRARMAALEAAILLYPEALDGACDRLVKQLRELKVKGVKTADLVRDARQIQKQLNRRPAIEACERRVLDLLPDAPIAASAVLPAGWQVTSDGLLNVANAALQVTAPVLIVERGRDIHHGAETITLAWQRESHWHKAVVDRKLIANARTIVDLAANGLPVTTNNARLLVQYLDEFEAVNLRHLPVTLVSHKMGWQGEAGRNGFLWGRQLILPERNAANGKNTSIGDCAASINVRFRGLDQGDDQLADGFRQSGTFDDWIEAIAPLADYPRALLGFYASFAPPLLPFLSSSNFVVDMSGPTTTGKTTILRCCASVWGNPDERSQAAALWTWNGTTTWRDRAPAVLNHLPFVLDETKHVLHPDEVAKTIYGVVQGRQRGRGTVQGIASQDYCQTVLVTSGEQPAISFTQDGGTRPRVITVWGSPFGSSNQFLGNLVRDINRGVINNFGHAGPRFIRYLLRRHGDWKKPREWYLSDIAHYEKRAGDNAIAGRMAAGFAVLCVASYLAHEALSLPWQWTDPIKPLWDELIQESGEADRAAVALRHVLSYAQAHRNDFYHLGRPESEQPYGGWAGRWDVSSSAAFQQGGSGWDWIGFLPHLLEKLLREAGFDANSTIRMWKDRGWFKTSTEATGTLRNQYRTKIGSEVVRVYAVTREAVEGVMEISRKSEAQRQQ